MILHGAETILIVDNEEIAVNVFPHVSFLHFFRFSIIKLISVCKQNKRKTCAWVAELVDARDLKSLIAKSVCEFDSRPRHQQQTHRLLSNVKLL